jgi:glycosyltransferase involved in cell wall biosynthesis
MLNGVTVHRFETARERVKEEFDAQSRKIDFESLTHSVEDERKWLDLQGPNIAGMQEWLEINGTTFDAAIVFTYLYETAGTTIECLENRIPVFLHATAHHEPPLKLQLIRERLRKVPNFFCSTPEEEELLRPLASPSARFHTVGIGVSLAERRTGAVNDVMARLKIPMHRYALILGRVDASKGVLDGVRHFRAYKESRETSLRLLVVGDNIERMSSDGDVTFTGYLSDHEMLALLRSAEILIQPSRYESFSLALCEAWLSLVPALVNGQCDVLVGQIGRSNGGLTYCDVDTFISQLQMLDESPQMRTELALAGKRFVSESYEPSNVVERIESALGAA